MSKQQKNSAFIKMLKEFPKAFGRVSFRERLMLRTAFDYINEEVIADIKANCDLAIEGRDVKIKELEKENAELKKQLEMSNKVYNDNLDYSHHIEEQLTKAKDHIKTLLDCLKQDTNDPQTNYYVCQYMDKAEQFIKEIEK